MNAKIGLIAAMKMSRDMLNSLLETIPPDKRTFQPCPTDNHVLWVLGHMPLGYGYFAMILGGTVTGVPETYNALFGPGSKPSGDPSAYPPYAELKRVFDSTYEQFMAIVEKMPESDLSKPPAIEADWLSDRLAALHAVVWHEGWHGGQIASVRRALGLPGVMGG